MSVIETLFQQILLASNCIHLNLSPDWSIWSLEELDLLVPILTVAFPAVASFSVQGTEYVVVKSPTRQCGQLEVVGQLKIDGQIFAVGRCSNVSMGGDVLAALSPRELEIARCIAAGYQTKAIAQRLRISYYTVRVHIGRIYCKLGLHKQTELASWISERYGRQRIDCPPSAPMRQIRRVEEEEVSG